MSDDSGFTEDAFGPLGEGGGDGEGGNTDPAPEPRGDGAGETQDSLPPAGARGADGVKPSVPISDPFFRPERLIDPEPTTVGNYRVLRTIGQGGMGVVYLARRTDESSESLVAIKVAQTARTQEAAKRLERERRVLFGLNHPNIGRIFDGGSLKDGRPYFVMEYIEGRTIDEYCDLNRLNTRERIQLFQKVCDAVTYCHKHLIVHRDIKPANILVTREGEPKLLDFGIVKLLNPDLLVAGDATVDVRGPMTIAYASPEQVSGGLITPSSDIYSLGVLLYRLLTGRLPYQLPDRWRQEVVDIICNESPELPSTVIRKTTTVLKSDTGEPSTVTPERLAELRSEDPAKLRRHLSGDLDDILLVALAKKPSLRYESATDLRRDLENHIEDRAVEARRRTKHVNWRYYALQRFAKRHRLSLSAGAAATLALIAGLVVALDQRALAIEQRDKSDRLATDLEELSGNVIDAFADEAVRLPGGRIVRERLFDDAAAILERALEREDLSDDTRNDIARRYIDLGRIAAGVREAGVGDFVRSLEYLGKAESVLNEAESPSALQRSRLETARGDVLRAGKDPGNAVERFEAAIAVLPSEVEPTDLRIIRAAVEARSGLAVALFNDSARADADRALDVARESVSLADSARQLVQNRDTRELFGYACHTGMTIAQAGTRRGFLSETRQARGWLERTLDIRADLVRDFPWDAKLRGELLVTFIWALEDVSESGPNAMLQPGEVGSRLREAWTHVRFLREADPKDNEAVRRLGGLIKVESELAEFANLGPIAPDTPDASTIDPTDLERLNRLVDEYRDAAVSLRNLGAVDSDNRVLDRLLIELETRTARRHRKAAADASLSDAEFERVAMVALRRGNDALALGERYMQNAIDDPDQTVSEQEAQAALHPLVSVAAQTWQIAMQGERWRASDALRREVQTLESRLVSYSTRFLETDTGTAEPRQILQGMIDYLSQKADG